MNSNKILRVVVKLKNGEERRLTFEGSETESINYNVCEKKCPYGKEICDRLSDPRSNGPEMKFSDFCTELGEGYDSVWPKEGTIEENLGDLYQDLLKTNAYVKLGDVVDSICSGGFCELYREDHELCTQGNELCILKSIIRNGRK